ncbi:VOC family protein [Streptomyces sp. NPDC093546]|uniref:VOC family protein n=1 Tax=Streptomyces sp. NPDC093546 TaxID=3366040 RepID=UPI00380493FB
MEILGATLRICLDDPKTLDESVLFYERLTGSRALRFERGGVSVAAVGCFLLMTGPEPELEVLRKVAATIAVDDVDVARDRLAEVGARVVAGPVPTPVGRNLIAAHPDGSVFEYVDRRRP